MSWEERLKPLELIEFSRTVGGLTSLPVEFHLHFHEVTGDNSCAKELPQVKLSEKCHRNVLNKMPGATRQEL